MVVRMRANRSHRDNRRAHFALRAPRFSACPDCGTAKLNHQVCPNCGKYKGRQVLSVGKKLAKMEKRRKESAKTK